MTKSDVLEVIRVWVDRVLNTENSLGYTVIFGNQNAPRPTLPYFVVQNPMIVNQKVGRGNWGSWEFTNEVADEGEVNYSIHYESTIQLEEIGGDGDTFRLLGNSINREDIKDYFRSENVSILRFEGESSNVDITEDDIEKRAIIDIIVHWTDQNSYDPSYIGEAEIEGTYIK